MGHYILKTLTNQKALKSGVRKPLHTINILKTKNV